MPYSVNGDELDNISNVIRLTLDMPELLLFDGDSKTDRIEKLIIDYHRVTKIKPKVPFNPDVEYATWDCSEQLSIDRASETLEHIQNIGTGCAVSRKYYVQEGVANLLDGFDAATFLSNTIGNPPDALDNPLETQDYQITVEFLYDEPKVITGTFDKNGLPTDFPELAEDIYSFMRFYGMGEILEPSIYRKSKRTRNDYIFCSVEFDEGEKSYYYLTEDESLVVGDLVRVPVGNSDRTAVVEIVDIEYFTEVDAPFPLDRVKSILERYVPSDEPHNPVILAAEPLPNTDPDDIREWVTGRADECELAKAYAAVHNQTGWLMHDLDDNDDPALEKRYEAWYKLETELCQRIIEILAAESPEETARSKRANKGTHYVIAPFMVKNGFVDRSGWWAGGFDGQH